MKKKNLLPNKGFFLKKFSKKQQNALNINVLISAKKICQPFCFIRLARKTMHPKSMHQG